MAPLRRRWRVAKWAGAGICFSLTAVCVFSLFWTVQYVKRGPSGFAVTLMNGAVELDQIYVGKNSYVGLRLHVNDLRRPYLAMPFVEYHAGSLLVFLNLLPVLMVSTFVVGLLFLLDRRRIAPHCCQACGYDLTGNASGTCPECGNGA